MTREGLDGSHRGRHLRGMLAQLDGVGGPVADFGCGEGLFTGAAGAYVGMDRSLGSARRVREAGFAAVVADVAYAPLRDATCAGVMCVNVLHAVPDPRRVLAEIDRVLKPDGRAYLKCDWFKAEAERRHPIRRGAQRFLHRLAFLWHRLHGGTGRSIVLRPTSRGWAICPHCCEEFFRRRGYGVARGRRYIVRLRKIPVGEKVISGQ